VFFLLMMNLRSILYVLSLVGWRLQLGSQLKLRLVSKKWRITWQAALTSWWQHVSVLKPELELLLQRSVITWFIYFAHYAMHILLGYCKLHFVNSLINFTIIKWIAKRMEVEVTEEWRKLYIEKLHNLYCSLYIVRMIQSRRMMWLDM
jgi:hypothetical protein